MRNVTIGSVSHRFASLCGLKIFAVNSLCASMELNPIIKVHDLLSHIEDTIAAWNPDEVEDNPNPRSVCKDVHRTCHAHNKNKPISIILP
jgi:hypothetical protein